MWKLLLDEAARRSKGAELQVNFGLYGSLQGDVLIDMNDFDEATLGPWE